MTAQSGFVSLDSRGSTKLWNDPDGQMKEQGRSMKTATTNIGLLAGIAMMAMTSLAGAQAAQ